MIKFYKNMTDYAKQNWIHRNTASKKFKNWELDLIEVPKGVKWYEQKDVMDIFRKILEIPAANCAYSENDIKELLNK